MEMRLECLASFMPRRGKPFDAQHAFRVTSTKPRGDPSVGIFKGATKVPVSNHEFVPVPCPTKCSVFPVEGREAVLAPEGYLRI